MDGRAEGGYWEGRGLVLLWVAMLAGPAAWVWNQLVGYALVEPACAAGAPLILTAVAIIALAAVSMGSWIAWRCLAKLDADAASSRPHEERSRFLAVIALSFNLLIALLILTAGTSPFILHPCE